MSPETNATDDSYTLKLHTAATKDSSIRGGKFALSSTQDDDSDDKEKRAACWDSLDACQSGFDEEVVVAERSTGKACQEDILGPKIATPRKRQLSPPHTEGEV